MTITNKAFRTAMKEAGLEKVQLEKGNGYFWIWSDDKELGIELAGISDVILCNSFKDQSIWSWIEDIKNLISECDKNFLDRPIVIREGWDKA